MVFSATGSKVFQFRCTFTPHCPSNFVENLTNIVLVSVHPCKALRWSSSCKNSTRLEVTGTVRFGKIFLNTWASKIYKDIQGRIGTYNFVVPGLSEPLF